MSKYLRLYQRNYTTMTTRIIGEITVISPKAEPSTAILPCKMPRKSELSISFFNGFGEFCGRKKFQLTRGITNLEIPLSHLDPGRYTLWIETNGETFLRNLSFAGQARQLSIIARLKRLINTPQPA